MFQAWPERCLLFLPAAGYREDSWLDKDCGRYWSTDASSETNACFLAHRASYLLAPNKYYRADGLSVRLATVVSELAGIVVLFLPAAGRHWYKTAENYWPFDVDVLALWSQDLETANNPVRVQASITSFVVAKYAASSRFSVRLATVVSDLAGEMSSVPAYCGYS